jgi:hypothetical protein
MRLLQCDGWQVHRNFENYFGAPTATARATTSSIATGKDGKYSSLGLSSGAIAGIGAVSVAVVATVAVRIHEAATEVPLYATEASTRTLNWDGDNDDAQHATGRCELK